MSSWRAEVKRRETAQRRAERDAKKRQRELERQLKEQAKLSEMERARLEVEQFDNAIEVLLSVQRDCSAPVDWVAFASALYPHPPIAVSKHEFFARLNQVVDWQRASDFENNAAIETARVQDQNDQATSIADYEAELSQWQRMRLLASKVINGDLGAYQEALGEFSTLGELSSLGSSIDLKFYGPKVVECELHVKGRDVIPAETKSLTAAGKLSVKAMPKSRFHEIYQDYVCGCVLRLAREVFALLPVDHAIVTAAIETVGRTRRMPRGLPVISVALPRQRIAGLDFEHLDPSDTIEDCLHRGDAKASRQSGDFVPIVPLSPTDVVPDEPRLHRYTDLLSIVGQLRSEFRTATQHVRKEEDALAASIDPTQ